MVPAVVRALGVEFRPIPVAAYDVGPTEPDLSDGTARRVEAGRRVDDPHVDDRERPPDAVRAGQIVGAAVDGHC